MPHIHVIDGKQQTYDDATCPFCHPERRGQPASQPQETLPRAYRKDNTVVIKVSKVTVVTFNHYPSENVWLLSIQRMKRDNQDKVMLGTDQKPLWENMTVRLPTSIVESWMMEVSRLVNEKKNAGTVPPRD